jgi:hypothetical protein
MRAWLPQMRGMWRCTTWRRGGTQVRWGFWRMDAWWVPCALHACMGAWVHGGMGAWGHKLYGRGAPSGVRAFRVKGFLEFSMGFSVFITKKPPYPTNPRLLMWQGSRCKALFTPAPGSLPWHAGVPSPAAVPGAVCILEEGPLRSRGRGLPGVVYLTHRAV